jgi:predicted regulator of Ras-like GTPase activity (Roadblock/LC7/MglB family)
MGGRSLQFTLSPEQVDRLEEVLQKNLVDLGVPSAVLIDMAGNIIAELDSGETKHDVYSLAALAAGNFGAVSAMAKIIGEDEFSLLFHKGEARSLHFTKIMNDFLLITIFGQETTLGFVRLKVAESVEKIEKILESAYSEE